MRALQIQQKRLDVNKTRVSLLHIVRMLQAVDWGPPVPHVASPTPAESVVSERSNCSVSTRADPSASGGMNEGQPSQSRDGSRTSSATGTSGLTSGGRGENENAPAAGVAAASWGGGVQRQLLADVAPEAEFVHADGDRLLQVCCLTHVLTMNDMSSVARRHPRQSTEECPETYHIHSHCTTAPSRHLGSC